MNRSPLGAVVFFVSLLVAASAGTASAQIHVVSTTPAVNANVPVTSTVSVEFDRPLDTATVTVDSFRVFGRGSGAARGVYSFSNGNRTVTLAPDHPFSAGELVYVNLSHAIAGADATMLRSAGYAFQFGTVTQPSPGTFQQIDNFTNRSNPSINTRIYGAAATDLDGDGYLDLATVNEDSEDVRVFLNLGDGSGHFGPMFPREPVGAESSPNEQADFDNDGNTDLGVGAATDSVVNVLLGAGDGTFASNQEIAVGFQAHGIVPIDVDGDGDLDIVNCNVGSNDLSLMINDGAGHFGAPSFFEAGVNGEYGLAYADMNRDGITDLVVGGRDGSQIRTLLGNGNGTFTGAGPAQSTGGTTWVVVLGDVNGDGDLDAVTANDGSNNLGILIGKGDGTFDPVVNINVGAHVPSVDLGDLDGDGDLDIVASSFGGGFWRRFANDGAGNFTFVENIIAPSNPSCSILFDFDNDGDLDMALTDEIADRVVLMQNEGNGSGPSSICPPAPSLCREPILAGKSKLTLVDKSPDDRDRLTWSWTRGSATAKPEFGDPLSTEGYELCLYQDGALVESHRIPAGTTCAGLPCWRDVPHAFAYRDRDLTPDGVQTAKLTEGAEGKATIKLAAKGERLHPTDPSSLSGTLDVQLHKTSGGACWGARFSPPYRKNDGQTLIALSDRLPPSWAAIHARIGGVCAGCHGASGGLGGFASCSTAYASLVNVASTELTSMDRVEPGDPATSWVMHKLDGTQDWFDAQCQGMFCGSRMPLGGPYLSLVTRDAIRTWITNGALNDCP
ncbi:MAG TPA: FG-GAP-like repeat-containing protein [Candidatus Binatia bacterium]|nr:FG-GAP-like repeat-containing protein [Candidatus Binatia bacterium]